MQNLGIRKNKIIRTGIITSAVFFALTNIVFGHGEGASVEATVDGYLVDIGLSEETFVADDLARFDFALIDESSGEEAAFSDVWFRVNKERKVFLATGIHRPELGQTGVSYVFPSEGEYQVSVRYQNKGETIVEHTFPVIVEPSPDGADVGQSGNANVLGVLVGGGLLGLLVGFFAGRRKVRNNG